MLQRKTARSRAGAGQIQRVSHCLNQPFLRGPARDRSTFLEGLQARERQLQASRDSDEARGLEGTMAREWFRLMGQQLQSSGLFRAQPPATERPGECPALPYLHDPSGRRAECPDFTGAGCGRWVSARSHTGRASLALDLLEPLRPLADAWVLSLCQQVLMPEHFTRESSGARYLSKVGVRCITRHWPIGVNSLQLTLRLSNRPISGRRSPRRRRWILWAICVAIWRIRSPECFLRLMRGGRSRNPNPILNRMTNRRSSDEKVMQAVTTGQSECRLALVP